MIHTYRFALMVAAASALLAAGPTAVRNPSLRQADAVIAQLPLRFEANQGQFDPAIRYAARTSAYTLALTAHGASLMFPGSHRRVTLSLAGSNASPAMEPLDRQATRIDYYIGPKQNWHTGVASYARVRYRSVYPGVDMVFYGNANRLEYDFVLQPGADPNAIRMQFLGAGAVRITAQGDLDLETPAGHILQKKPAVYQNAAGSARRAVSGGYSLLADGAVGIRVDRYDRSQPLVIDPTIVYSTLMGGGGTETTAGMKLKNGLLYVAGSTQTGDWTVQTTDLPYDNLQDAFLMIIDTTSPGGFSVKYFTYLGGTGDDVPQAVDVDAPGFVYLVGTTSSIDFPIYGNSLQTTGASSNTTAFIAKLDPHYAGTGESLVFSSYLGGTLGTDAANGLAVDPSGSGIIYMIGTTGSADFPITPNAYAASLYGPTDCFMAQVDTVNGILLYSSFFGSEADDDGRAIALGPNGLVYYAATSAGTQFPTAGYAYNNNSSGSYDVVVGAFDLTQSGVNTLVYGTYLGGSQIDEVRGMSLDAHGRMILTGYTLSPDFPVTALTAAQPKYGGNGDAFVTLVDLTQPPSSFLVYSTFLGGSDGDVGYGVLTDSLGYMYVTGYSLSADFPVTNNAPQPNWGGGIDMFVTRINPGLAGAGGLDYSTYIGVDSTIVGCCLLLGPDGSLFVFGYTENYLPLLPGLPDGPPIQGVYGGGFSDDFLLVFSPGSGLGGAASPAASALPRQVPAGGMPARPPKKNQ